VKPGFILINDASLFKFGDQKEKEGGDEKLKNLSRGFRLRLYPE
jgi:hypothetical protein